jgi:biopolymer transport protein ExbD
MKKTIVGLVLLFAISVCAPAFGQNDQVYWHDSAQKQAQKLQKQQQKAYNKALKKQQKLLKKEQKRERKQAKRDIKASHYPKDITR